MKKDKTYWNYRIVTKLFTYFEGKENERKERLFSITEVYYKDGKPDSYIEPESINILYNVESIENLKWIRKKLKKALKRPLLDLDNWPAKWENNDNRKNK